MTGSRRVLPLCLLLLAGCARLGFEPERDSRVTDTSAAEQPRDGSRDRPGIDAPGKDSRPRDGRLADKGKSDSGGSVTPKWAKRYGGTGTDACHDVTVDGSGNVIITGRFEGSVSFGGATLASANSWDIFLARYDSSGTHLWSKRFGGSGMDYGNGVAVDASGNIYLAGEFESTVDFSGGGPELTSAGSNDIFVASYTPSGAHRWSKRFGSSAAEMAHGVTVDASGNVTVTGEAMGLVNFGGVDLASQGATDIFVASFTSAGTHRWSGRHGGTGYDVGSAVAADASGNVTAVGWFSATASLGGAALVSSGQYDAFVASYSPTGAHRWSRRAGSTGADFGHGVAVDGSGNVTATGQFTGTVDFGGSALTSAGSYDGFVASYTSTGLHRWSSRFGGVVSDASKGIATDGGGNVFVTGDFEGSVSFGGTALTSAGDADVFAASFTSAGAHRWSRRFGGASGEWGNATATGLGGNVVFVGAFTGSADLGGPAPYVSAGLSDVFVIQLGP